MWWGQLSVDNGLWRVILCMLAFPLLSTSLISFRCRLAVGLQGCGAMGWAWGSGPSIPNAPTRGKVHVSSGLGRDPRMAEMHVGIRQREGCPPVQSTHPA